MRNKSELAKENIPESITNSDLTINQNRTKTSNDRFIPQRKPTAHSWAEQAAMYSDTKDSAKKKNPNQIFQSLAGSNRSRILKFRSEYSSNKKQGNFDILNEPFGFGKSIVNEISKKVKEKRILPKRAEKVLDAPGLINDYYLNLIDWGANNL